MEKLNHGSEEYTAQKVLVCRKGDETHRLAVSLASVESYQITKVESLDPDPAQIHLTASTTGLKVIQSLQVAFYNTDLNPVIDTKLLSREGITKGTLDDLEFFRLYRAWAENADPEQRVKIKLEIRRMKNQRANLGRKTTVVSEETLLETVASEINIAKADKVKQVVLLCELLRKQNAALERELARAQEASATYRTSYIETARELAEARKKLAAVEADNRGKDALIEDLADRLTQSDNRVHILRAGAWSEQQRHETEEEELRRKNFGLTLERNLRNAELEELRAERAHDQKELEKVIQALGVEVRENEGSLAALVRYADNLRKIEELKELNRQGKIELR